MGTGEKKGVKHAFQLPGKSADLINIEEGALVYAHVCVYYKVTILYPFF